MIAKGRLEAIMEGKQTSQQALEMALKAHRELSLPGSNWTKQANHIIARNVLDAELERYADEPPIYRLDQETRDRLLVHARQDAAEALLQARSLVDEVHRLKSVLRSLNFSAWFLFASYFLWLWWKAGFVVPAWLR
jgi:hypothetical protein